MVRLSNVCKIYENGTAALTGVNLNIEEGELVFIVGTSASGKSTIVKILTCEIEMDDGRGQVNGFDINRIKASRIPELRRTIGVVFQDFRLIERKTVFENVEFAMRAVGSKLPMRKIRKRIMYVLELVGLKNKVKSKPSELSGGEQQRVAIARAIINNPRLIIADEPTGNLDPKMSKDIMTLLERINTLGTTVLIVTHEKELVNQFDRRVVVIDEGKVVSDRKGGYYHK